MRPFRFASSSWMKALGLALALLFVTPQALFAQQAQQVSSRAQLPPTQYIPSRNYDTRHITLNLRFNWDKEQALGTATISFAPLTNNVRTVEFDAANMSFNSVKLASGSPLQYTA
ncbi:MAG TPA: hypothetical protein VEQ40_13560, partial [Pyrinomonadaceae bacterium]|nr:hypothetical protein [Pyrinomonadaceae bacterium]